jgi:hypothetical protein
MTAVEQGPPVPDETNCRSGSAGDSADEANLRDRAARLFRFLAELTALRIKKTRDVTAYESVFWFKDLPNEREVYSHALGTLTSKNLGCESTSLESQCWGNRRRFVGDGTTQTTSKISAQIRNSSASRRYCRK